MILLTIRNLLINGSTIFYVIFGIIIYFKLNVSDKIEEKNRDGYVWLFIMVYMIIGAPLLMYINSLD